MVKVEPGQNLQNHHCHCLLLGQVKKHWMVQSIFIMKICCQRSLMQRSENAKEMALTENENGNGKESDKGLPEHMWREQEHHLGVWKEQEHHLGD